MENPPKAARNPGNLDDDDKDVALFGVDVIAVLEDNNNDDDDVDCLYDDDMGIGVL